MGCFHSKALEPATEVVKVYPEEPEEPAFDLPQVVVSSPPADIEEVQELVQEKVEQRMHQLLCPECYKDRRPSFYAAYARAARRYGFEAGRYAGFCKRNNVVVKLKSRRERDPDHEVPAESVQNGACTLLRDQIHRMLRCDCRVRLSCARVKQVTLMMSTCSLEYVVPVTVGTPGITANLDFDTGSSDLWIWSSELASASKYSKSHHIYDPHRSKTSKKASGTWNISYGDGSTASGDVYNDTVSVAGVTIKSQAVECAKKLSSSFLQDGGNDGLLGLAWPALNTVEPHRVKTPVQNMIEQKAISKPLFTVKLGSRGEAGFYSFGGSLSTL
jgi:hypothetical protein